MEVLLGCLLCGLFIVLQYLLTRRKANKLPPGPARLPIIGNLHNLGSQPHRSLADLAKIHGPLMSLKLGQVTTIVASSPAVAKEILQKQDQLLSDRQVVLAVRALDHHQFSVAWLPVGSKWRNLRKISNSHLFATQKLDFNEELRREKVQELMEDVRRNASERPGEAVDVGRAAFRASLNAVSRTMFSLDLADDGQRSDTAREFKEVSRLILEEAGKPNLGDYFPLLARWDLQGIQRRMTIHFGKVFVSAMKQLGLVVLCGLGSICALQTIFTIRLGYAIFTPPTVFDMFGKVIDERLRQRESEGYVSANDMLDMLLDIGADQNSREETAMDPLRIKHLFFDLFLAGTDTTSSTLVFLGSEVDAKGNYFELIPFGVGRRICPGLPLATRMLHMMLGSFDWKLGDEIVPEMLDMEEKFGISLEKAKPLFVVMTPR
ncbi:unnamed protein product [Linum trigynum]|uniref:Cytochrome P450 n=1 Tax=Linum trigynum TaxID=586398 RepID=A0AAV2EQS5_9ROSI